MSVLAVRSMPRWLAGLVGLFAVQLFMCSLSVFPEQDLPAWLERAVVLTNARPLIYGAIPAGMFAYFLARILRATERSAGIPWLPTRFVALAWAAVWLSCWAALYSLLAGSGIALWSASSLAQPITWASFGLCMAGLLFGARTGREA